ncbi:hypothetical protein [Amycolatopsis vastitatis]|nr:hypothetical protein [Amycolatopsis vastitatis]
MPARVIRRVLLAATAGQADPRGLRIRGARITGQLDLTHAYPAIGLGLIDCAFDQGIELQDAHLPWLSLTGSHVPQLIADRMQTDGVLKLDSGFRVVGSHSRGAVCLVAAHIRGQLDMSGAHLDNQSGPALVADRIQVEGTACFKGGFHAAGAGEDGTIRMPESHIAGQLVLSNSELSNRSGPAFVGEQLVVDGAVFMNQPFVATGHGVAGTVRLTSASLGSELSLAGARLSNDSGPALSADGLRVATDLALSEDFQADGRGERGAIRLTGAHIEGEFDASNAHATNPTGPGLSARDIRVGEALYIGEGFSARGAGKWGALYLTGATIVGPLVAGGARLRNSSGPSMRAERLHALSDVRLDKDVTVKGEIRLQGTVIEGKLDFSGVEVRRRNGCILDLAGSKTKEVLLPADLICTDQDEHACGDAARVDLTGFTYAQFIDIDPKRWLGILRHHTDKYRPQPYQQLALLLKSQGHDNPAREVLRAQQDDLRARGDLGNLLARVSHWAWGVFAGYGYRVRRVAGALAVALFVAAALGVVGGSIQAGANGKPVVAPTSAAAAPGTTCSFIERIGVGLDRGLPLASTGIRDRCDLDTRSTAGQIFTALLWGIQVVIWALATLALAGYTGLIRKLN